MCVDDLRPRTALVVQAGRDLRRLGATPRRAVHSADEARADRSPAACMGHLGPLRPHSAHCSRSGLADVDRGVVCGRVGSDHQGRGSDCTLHAGSSPGADVFQEDECFLDR